MNALEALFSWVLTATWQASVLALLVLLAHATLGRRLNPRWRYALWLLVVLRLLLPALPESALSLFQFTPPPPAPLVTVVTEPWHPLFTDHPDPSPANPAPQAKPNLPLSWFSVLSLLWLGGASLLLILTLEANRRFARHVANSPEITDPDILAAFARARNELNIRRRIRLIENSQVQSPAIMGLFRPTLLLPADVRGKFDARELRFIFLHELAHLKRGDILVQALIALLQIVHWFNPILWYAFRRMRIDREPATDALVLCRTGEADKEHYGLMLIKLLDHFNQRHSLPTLVGILEDKDQFKRRFTLIARFTRGAHGWSLLGVFVIGSLAVLCLTKSKAETSMPPSDNIPSKAFVRISLQVVQLGEEDYRPHQAEIEAALQRGDANFFSQFKTYNLVSKLAVLVKPGERGVLESVRVLPYPVAYGTDSSGKIAPTEFKRRDLGTRMYLWPQVDHGKITLDGALQVTSLNCWVDVRKGEPAPAFNVMGATLKAETFAPGETKGFSFTGDAHEQPLDPTQSFGPDKNIAAFPHQFGRMFYFIQTSLADAPAARPAATQIALPHVGDDAKPASAPTSAGEPTVAQKSLLDAKMDADARRVLVEKLETMSDDQFVATLQGLGRADPNLTALDQKIADEKASLTNLLNDGYTPGHPRIVAMTDHVASLQIDRKTLVAGLRRAMDIDLQAADARVTSLTQPAISNPTDLQEQILQAREDTEARRVLVTQLKVMPDEQFVPTLEALGHADPAITGLEMKIQQQNADVTRLLNDGFANDHPRIVSLRAEIASRQEELERLIDGKRRAMDFDLEMAQSRVALLQRIAGNAVAAPKPANLRQELVAAQQDADACRVLLDRIKELPEEQFVATVQGLGRSDADLDSLDRKIADEKADISNLLGSGFSPTHPRIVTMRAEVADRQRQRDQLVEGVRQAMDIELRMADSRVLLLRTELDNSDSANPR